MEEEIFLDQYQRVYAEVSLDAVRSNADQMSARLAEGTQMIAVIKTDGYGHGAAPIARELENLDYLWGFATATAEEAFALRREGITCPLLVLGYTFPDCFERMIREDIRITVFREDTLNEIARIQRCLQQKGISRKARVHIKVDTGMSRIGVRPDEGGLSFVKKVFEMEELEAEGIFTHFARADEEDQAAAEMQLGSFEDFLCRVRKSTGREIPLKHCSNSAGIIELPQAGMDAVRAGIALYGLWPSDQVSRNVIALTPAMSLYSRIIYVKEIEPGTEVSYGGTFVAEKPMRIATVPVGYGDGYPRGLSGKGYVLVHGRKAPVLGRICMDQFMIDVSEIPGAAEGDKVTLLGRDQGEEITMEQLGALSGRFNYELACCISKRVPRLYMREGKVVCVADFYRDF